MKSPLASYYRARYYDPGAGRFLDEDPLGFLAGVNKYRFLRNSPLNWVDRFGTSESGCDCPDSNGNVMPRRRRLGLAFSGIANVLAGGAGMTLALSGAEAGTVGMATPIAGYVAVQGAGHFVQGLTEIAAAVVGDNAGEALVGSAKDVTNNISILGLASGLMHNRDMSATSRGAEGLITTLIFEPENVPLIALEGAHAAQEGLGLFSKKCPEH
jgi:uncharacterized protein RhaS with RHS repeats